MNIRDVKNGLRRAVMFSMLYMVGASLAWIPTCAWATPPDIGSDTSIILKDRTGYNGTSSIEALEMYKRGHTFFNAEEWEFARRMWKKAVKRDKTFVEAYDMLGIANRKLGRLDAALAAFQRSHELFPDGKVALVNMGLIQLQQREWSAAEHAYLELMKRHPNYAEGPYGLSNVYLNNGQLEQVVDQALAAVSLYKAAHSPYWVHAEYNAGIAYVMMGENEAAVPHLIAARDHGMSLSPQLIDIIDSIASAHNDKEPMPISADTPCDGSVMQTVHGPSSHPEYKTLVLQCIDVVASIPTPKPEAPPNQRLQVTMAWLLKEMTNHPTAHIVVQESFWKGDKDEPELTMIFMLGWFKVYMEDRVMMSRPSAKIERLPPINAAVNAAAIRFVLAYQQRHGYTPTGQLKVYAEAEKAGTLDALCMEIATKGAANTDP